MSTGKSDIFQKNILWKAFVSGDNDAYASLYKQYVNDLYAYGMFFTEDKELVKDCVQDVFVKIYKNRASLSHVQNPKTFLYFVMKNRLFDLFRKKRFFYPIDAIESAFLADYTVEDQIMAKDTAEFQTKKIARILEMLTPRQKEAIFYRFVEDLDLEEISKLMNMNYQSVQNLIQRSIKKAQNTFLNKK